MHSFSSKSKVTTVALLFLSAIVVPNPLLAASTWQPSAKKAIHNRLSPITMFISMASLCYMEGRGKLGNQNHGMYASIGLSISLLAHLATSGKNLPTKNKYKKYYRKHIHILYALALIYPLFYFLYKNFPNILTLNNTARQHSDFLPAMELLFRRGNLLFGLCHFLLII